MKSTCWLTLGLDVLNQKCFIMGFSRNKEAAIRSKSRAPEDVAYTFVDSMSDELGGKIFAWLRSCGILPDTAKEIVQQIGKAILQIMKEK